MGKQGKNDKPLDLRQQVILLAAILVPILLIIDIFVTGYIKFSYNYLQCGHSPLVATPNGLYGGNSGYSYPGSSTYQIRANSLYYCTQEQAEQAGTKPNPFSKEGQKRLDELEAQ